MNENENKMPSHWDILIGQDPELNDKVQAWRSHINNTPALERKYKELLMVSMACILRFDFGIECHAQFARDFGASKEEIFAAIEQSFCMGGIPAFRAGANAFYKLFKDELD